ncbi:MAG: ferrochelatase [Proteobacteria bacterium]|nr:ferrochelatase [Pseudomonadota bacterium]
MAWFRGTSVSTEPPSEAGVLLVNLGTPAAPTYGAIRRYLAAFLGDRRVVEACPAYWYPILYGPILTFRPARTARLYRSVWTPEGSPLLVNSARLAAGLQARLGEPARTRVELAMTYGEPSMATALERLIAARVRSLTVLPLYPQYSGSTTGAVFDVLARELARYRHVPALRFVSDYHDHPAYIDALAASVREAFAAHGRSHLVLSNHGVPVKYVAEGDPYRTQVERTNALVAAALGLGPDEWSQTYQSRFGPTEWLRPSTDERLAELAREGVRSVTVATPSFAVDCLETLEEIGIASRERFLAAGGERFTLVPALNDAASHVAALAAIVEPAAR